jgi:hypothetical protein
VGTGDFACLMQPWLRGPEVIAASTPADRQRSLSATDYALRDPAPGSRAAKMMLVGCVLATVGGILLGNLK